MYYSIKVKDPKEFLVFIVMSVIIIISVHFVLNAGLSCVDSDGCLRKSCDYNLLSTTYKELVDKNRAQCLLLASQ